MLEHLSFLRAHNQEMEDYFPFLFTSCKLCQKIDGQIFISFLANAYILQLFSVMVSFCYSLSFLGSLLCRDFLRIVKIIFIIFLFGCVHAIWVEILSVFYQSVFYLSIRSSFICIAFISVHTFFAYSCHVLLYTHLSTFLQGNWFPPLMWHVSQDS